MKKAIAVILALIVLSLAIAGCLQANEEQKPAGEPAQASEDKELQDIDGLLIAEDNEIDIGEMA